MEKSFFFNARKTGETYDRIYQAEDFASYFSEFIGNGIFPNPSTGLQVLESSEKDMTTVLKPGAAFINGYGYRNTADIIFEHKVADGVLNRKDAIFIRFDKAGRAIGAIKMEGSVGAEAVAPKVIRTADYYDLCVAIVSINAGTTGITQDMIEDTRLSTDLCGIVHNVVDQIDTETLYKQIQSDLERFRNVSQAEFDAWFEDINAKLGEEPATSLQKQINDIVPNLVYVYKATFLTDSWEGEGPYTQTAVVTPDDGGPDITEGSKMQGGITIWDGFTGDTYVKMNEAGAIVNAGTKTLGAGTITCVTKGKDKPACDVEIFFQAKVGGVT